MNNPTQGSLLVVSGDAAGRDSLVQYLEQHGYRVRDLDSAAATRRRMRSDTYDLILIDCDLPGDEGLNLCRHLCEAHGAPVVLYASNAESTDRIVGLEMGADDFLAKPFNPREMLARIRAVLRRSRSLPPLQRPASHEGYMFGRWTLRTEQRELLNAAGKPVRISSGEYRLLVSFLERPNIVLTREQLLDLTRGRDASSYDRSVDNQISRLRRKIELDPAKPQIIKTVWGGGYIFAASVRRL